MVNWKKWFLEEEVDDYLEEKPNEEKNNKQKEDDFEIQFADKKEVEKKEKIDVSRERMGRIRHKVEDTPTKNLLDEEEEESDDFSDSKEGLLVSIKKLFIKDTPKEEEVVIEEREITSFKDLDEYRPKEKKVVNTDDKFEDDFVEEVVEQRKNDGFLNKLKSMFVSPNKEHFEDELFEEEQPEDYKTYLERQKKENIDIQNIEKDDFEDDDFSTFEDEEETSFFDKIKNKIKSSRQNEKEESEQIVVEENDENFEIKSKDSSFEDDDFEIVMEDEDSSFFDREKDKKKLDKEGSNFFDRLKSRVLDPSEEQIERELEKEEGQYEESIEKTTPTHLDNYVAEVNKQEKDKQLFTASVVDEEQVEVKKPVREKVTEEKIEEKLKQLDLENKEIQDVDIFAEREGRKPHPTLAAMRVKRLRQEDKIDSLGEQLIFEKDGEGLKNSLANKKEEQVVVEEEKENHVSKNADKIEKLQEDFNRRQRKVEKIEDTSIYRRNDKKLDEIFNTIKSEEERSSKKDSYELELKEQNYNKDQEDYRRTIRSTTVQDVLDGTEDLFEDDIDKTSKKLVGRHLDSEQSLASEDVENFRKDVYSGNVYDEPQEKTELDELIKEANIKLVKVDKETTPEIESLNDNLLKLQQEKKSKVGDEIVEKEGTLEEQLEKLEQEKYPDYEQFAKHKKENILDGYSDYHLDEEELKELEQKTKLPKVDIDSLTKEVVSHEKIGNDVDKFIEEKTMPRKNTYIIEEQQPKEEKNEIEDFEPEFEEAKQTGIEYEEKLYTDDVTPFFEEKGLKTTKLGEYKTVDRGYRPVSKERIENNQKILDAIFDKYSTTSISSNKSVTTKMYETNTITPTRSTGKFKPSPVYSSIYGSAQKKTVEKPKKEQTKEIKSVEIYKEIASQKDKVWEIGKDSNRVPKNVKANKKKK